MICFHCGRKIPDDVKYCPECGTATKLVGAAPTETIKLDEEIENLEPAPAPEKPKLELPELPKLSHLKADLKAEMQGIKETKQENRAQKAERTEWEKAAAPRWAGKKRPWALLALVAAVAVFALVVGSLGGAEDPASSGAVSAPAELTEPIVFMDAALWNVDWGEAFPFTHAYDMRVHEDYALQRYGQIYLDPDEALELFAPYFDTYLCGEAGFVQTGSQSLDVDGLNWEYVWFSHPDPRVQDFGTAEMNNRLAKVSCDLAYAFQQGADDSLLVTCYYSRDLAMQVGALPAVTPLAPRESFTDPALWYAHWGDDGRIWRVGRPQKRTASYRQAYGTELTTARAADRLLGQFIEQGLLAEQKFVQLGSQYYENESVALGLHWFRYTGDRDLAGFYFESIPAEVRINDCDLVLGYYSRGEERVELFSYFSRDLIPRTNDAVEIKELMGRPAGESYESVGEPVIPAGALPDLSAFVGSTLTLRDRSDRYDYAELHYDGYIDPALLDEYVALLQEQYGAELVSREVDADGFFQNYTYLLRDPNGSAGFAYRGEQLSLMIQYRGFGRSSDIELRAAAGTEFLDLGDRSRLYTE